MMQLSKNYKIVFIFLFITSVSFSQVKDSISFKNKELQNIKNEIARLENELKSKSKKERESLQSLELINRQNLLISKLINKLIAQEHEKENAIKLVEESTYQIEKKIDDLKNQYSRYVVWFYKNKGISIWRFIVDAESFNQALIRFQYFRYIWNQNKLTLEKLNNNKIQLSKLRDTLEYQRREKKILANQKLKEKEELNKIEKEKRELISILKRDQKMINEEIASKRRAEIAIKNLIAKLIEQERQSKIKRLELKKENNQRNKKLPQVFDYSSLENFASLKGKLGWPIREGRVIRSFGENKNERLNTVTLNYGIDIASSSNSSVQAVAEGFVSAIDWIPGYGSIIILTHNDDYRTVYGHVTNIAVKEGDRIKAGSIIGQVNESLEGKILHFEIWNERNYQNPESWLARR